MNALVPAKPTTPPSHAETMEMATVLAQSGAFPTVQKAAEAYAVIVIGQSFGMLPGEALMAISLVQGKPSFDIHWQAARLRQLGHDYTIVRLDGAACTIQFLRHGTDPAPPITMTLTSAQQIKIHDKLQGQNATLAGKWNYKSWAEDMLYAYCMRRVVRRYCPEVLGGYLGHDTTLAEMDEAGVVEGEILTAEQVAANVDELYGTEKPTSADDAAQAQHNDVFDAIMKILKARSYGQKQFALWLAQNDLPALADTTTEQREAILAHLTTYAVGALAKPLTSDDDGTTPPGDDGQGVLVPDPVPEKAKETV